MIKAKSLEEAHQLIQELRIQQTDLESQNQKLKLELKTLSAKNQNGSSGESPHLIDTGAKEWSDGELSPNKGLLRCIIDTVGDLIYVKDIEGVYRGCNKASERFIGLRETEQIGKTDFDFFSRDKAEAIQDADKLIATSGDEYCGEEWILASDGKKLLLETKKAPFYGLDGNVAGIVGISRDVTERKMAEDRLRESNKELDAFVQTVAHDLRTPLTPIIGYAEILRENYKEQLDEQGLSYLAEIEKAGEGMLALMEALLSLAKSGDLKFPTERVSTDDVVAGVIKNLEAGISAAGVVLQTSSLPSVRVPKTCLIQIFDNLIGNAVRYAGSSGGLVEVGGEQTGKQTRFFVRDHGPGIPEQERERVFEIFYRGINKEETKGSGVGLAIVYKIARNCGGRTWVEETPGGGCTFWVEIEDVDQF